MHWTQRNPKRFQNSAILHSTRSQLQLGIDRHWIESNTGIEKWRLDYRFLHHNYQGISSDIHHMSAPLVVPWHSTHSKNIGWGGHVIQLLQYHQRCRWKDWHNRWISSSRVSHLEAGIHCWRLMTSSNTGGFISYPLKIIPVENNRVAMVAAVRASGVAALIMLAKVVAKMKYSMQ